MVYLVDSIQMPPCTHTVQKYANTNSWLLFLCSSYRHSCVGVRLTYIASYSKNNFKYTNELFKPLEMHAVFLPAITGKMHSAGQWTGTIDTLWRINFFPAPHHNHALKNHSSYMQLWLTIWTQLIFLVVWLKKESPSTYKHTDSQHYSVLLMYIIIVVYIVLRNCMAFR